MMSMQKAFLLDTSNGQIFGNQETLQYKREKREKSLLTSFNPDICRGYLETIKTTPLLKSLLWYKPILIYSKSLSHGV